MIIIIYQTSDRHASTAETASSTERKRGRARWILLLAGSEHIINDIDSWYLELCTHSEKYIYSFIQMMILYLF